MSRLYDRVMAHGCEPLTARHIFEGTYDPDSCRRYIAEALGSELGREPTPEEVSERTALIYAMGQRHVSTEPFDAADFEDAVVVSAEEVADLCATFPEGTDSFSIVDRLAPSFDRMFVEFQNRPNAFGLWS